MRKKKRKSGVERVHPPGAFCASCVRDIGGKPWHEAPIGRNGAMVTLCASCDEGPVRERSHLFGGSRLGNAVGDGNRRNGSGGAR